MRVNGIAMRFRVFVLHISFLMASISFVVRIFFFSSRRRHTRYIGDWSSDVCSSDLHPTLLTPGPLSDCFSLKRRAACHPERSARNARVAKDLLLRRVAKNLLVLGPYERQVVPWPVDFGTAHSTHMQPAEDSMSKLRVHNFAISLDGYGAGPRQGLKDPLGVGGEELHGWYVGTRAFHEINGKTGGTTGPDNEFAKRFGERIGAYIMGRNMFGPVRGPWPDDRWRGWGGENPPYHVPVFVLTNHAREPITMKGGTVFHFVTGGIEEALRRARQAAGELEIQVGGGASTVRQYLQARLIDEMHVAIAPILLGSGEALFAGMDLPALGYACTEHVATPAATHVVLARKA